jgi:hypothetical protein
MLLTASHFAQASLLDQVTIATAAGRVVRFTDMKAFGRVGKILHSMVVHARRWTGWSGAPDAKTPGLRMNFGRCIVNPGVTSRPGACKEVYCMRILRQSPLPTLSAGERA